MQPPVERIESPADRHHRCDTCGTVFPERAGGSVVFASTSDRSSRRWFCPRHLGPAFLLRRVVTAEAAADVLQPAGRTPYEYNEVPPGAEVDGLDRGEPMLGTFVPMPDTAFEDLDSEALVIAARVTDDVVELMRTAQRSFAALLGVDFMRLAGSMTTPDTIWSSRGGDLAGFVIDGADGMHSRLLLQQREASVVDIVATPGPAPTFDRDGQALLEHLDVTIAPSHRATLDPALQTLIAALSEPAVDPFDPAPDLVDVDLGRGVIGRGRAGRSHVDWRIEPLALADAHRRLVELVPTLFAQLGFGEPPELEVSSDRSWSPMDRATPPNCPFTDRTWLRAGAHGERLEVTISSESANWSESEISNVGTALSIRVDEVRIYISARGSGPTGACTSLYLTRPSSAVVVDALRAAFADVLR